MLQIFSYFHDKINELHIHLSIANFAVALISVFVPVFLIGLNYSIPQIMLYYFILYASFAIFSLLIFNRLKVSFKLLISLRPIFLIATYAWLYSLNYLPSTLFLLAAFNGFAAATYWGPFHFFFAKKASQDLEEQVGWLFALPSLLSITAPVIGGLIITYFSFTHLFIAVSIILFVSLIPLAQLPDYRMAFSLDLKKLFEKHLIKYYLGFISDGISSAVLYTLLPLYIYLLFSTALSLGFYSTFFALTGSLTPLVVSSLVKKDFPKFIKFGAVLELLTFMLVFFATSQFEFFIISSFLGVFTTFWYVPFYTKLYKQANEKHTLEFIMAREFLLNGSCALVFAAFLLFGGFMPTFVLELLSRLLFLPF